MNIQSSRGFLRRMQILAIALAVLMGAIIAIPSSSLANSAMGGGIWK